MLCNKELQNTNSQWNVIKTYLAYRLGVQLVSLTRPCQLWVGQEAPLILARFATMSGAQLALG